MCVHGIPATTEFNPGDHETSPCRGSASDEPITLTLGIGHLLTVWVGHGLVNLVAGDASFRVIFFDVLPVGTVPDDRPVVHNREYTSTGYTLGIGVASGI